MKILKVDDSEILPGTIGLTQIAGDVGKLIRFGQWLNGDGFADYQHAFMYVGNGNIVEAEPGGARIRSVTEYSDVYWCKGIASAFHDYNLTQAAAIAQSFEGIPYSFLDYLALATHRLHIPGPFLRKYVNSTGHMICSQLVAAAYQKAGMQIHDDPWWPGYVTPLHLYDVDQWYLHHKS